MRRRSSRPASGGGERGLTLVELLVVITVLGVLAAIVVFATGGIGDRGEQSAREADARVLRTAQEAHCASTDPPRYAEVDELFEKGLLTSVSTLNDVELGADGHCGTGHGSSFRIFDGSSAVEPVRTISSEELGMGQPRRVAVNAETNKIYVTRQLGGMAVLDGTDDTVLKLIPAGGDLVENPWNMVVDEQANRIYVTCGTCNAISVIDGSDDTVLRRVDTPAPVVDMVVNPATGKLYLGTRADSGTRMYVLARDAGSVMLLSTAHGLPELPPRESYLGRTSAGGFAVNSETNTVYVPVQYQDGSLDPWRLLIIDGDSDAVRSVTYESEVSTPQAASFRRPLVHEATNRVYLAALTSLGASTTKVWILDGSSHDHEVVASHPGSGEAVRGEWGLHPSTNKIYMASYTVHGGPFAMSRFDPVANDYTQQATIGHGLAQRGAMVINPADGRVYLPLERPAGSPRGAGLSVLSTTTMATTHVLDEQQVYGVAVNRETFKAYAISEPWTGSGDLPEEGNASLTVLAPGGS